MKFLVDARLPPALAAWLRDKGHDAVPVRDIGLREAPDATIWSHAEAEGAVIVTKDEDFALAIADHATVRVLWVRTGNAVNRVLLARFEAAWPEIELHFDAGVRLVELR